MDRYAMQPNCMLYSPIEWVRKKKKFNQMFVFQKLSSGAELEWKPQKLFMFAGV